MMGGDRPCRPQAGSLSEAQSRGNTAATMVRSAYADSASQPCHSRSTRGTSATPRRQTRPDSASLTRNRRAQGWSRAASSVT